MNATSTLPPGYSFAWQINLKDNLRLNLLLQVAGLFWFGLLVVPLWWAFSQLRPRGEDIILFNNSLGFLLNFLLVGLIAISLHELAHGAAFWWFSRALPKFGFGPGYAYAALPGWYFPKKQYLVVGLAPLVGLTALGLALVPFLPNSLLGPFFLGMVLNAGGSIGDVYICLRIGFDAPDVLIKDTGDGIEVYRRA